MRINSNTLPNQQRKQKKTTIWDQSTVPVKKFKESRKYHPDLVVTTTRTHSILERERERREIALFHRERRKIRWDRNLSLVRSDCEHLKIVIREHKTISPSFSLLWYRQEEIRNQLYLLIFDDGGVLLAIIECRQQYTTSSNLLQLITQTSLPERRLWQDKSID